MMFVGRGVDERGGCRCGSLLLVDDTHTGTNKQEEISQCKIRGKTVKIRRQGQRLQGLRPETPVQVGDSGVGRLLIPIFGG